MNENNYHLKKAYHPNGQYISFEEQGHRYIDNFGKNYLSGTSLIKQFFPKFDAQAIAQKCSEGKNEKYAGRSPEEIQEEWAKEAKRGREEGSNVHLYAEGLISKWKDDKLPVPISERCAQLFIQAEQAVSELLSSFLFIGAEVIVFSPDLGISGMIDLLMFDQKHQQVIIFDWKQNKNLSENNPWQMGLLPIDHLQNSDINHYTLQLSLYQYILERENYFPGFNKFKRELIHLKSGDYKRIPLEYFDYEIKEILNHVREKSRD